MSVGAAIALGAQLITVAPQVIEGVRGIFASLDKPAPKKKKRRAPPKLGPFDVGSLEAGGVLPRFDEEQSRSVAAIVGMVSKVAPMFPDPGIAIGLSWALVVNAYTESRLRPGAHNPRGEDSRGLFQINVRAHPHLASVNLYDPEVNAAAFLRMCFKDKRILAKLSHGRVSIAELTHDICYHVERPRHRAVSARKRARTSAKWLGQWALVPVVELDG